MPTLKTPETMKVLARAEAQHEIAGAQAEAERGRHVVPRAGADDRATPPTRLVHGPEHRGEQRRPVAVGVDEREQVGAVAPLRG